MDNTTQNVQDLLKPRWIVIAVYPYCPYEIGDLIEISDAGTSFHCCTTKEWNEWENDFSGSHNYFSLDQINNFPALFRELSWYENREIEEMPRYIKRLSNGAILPVFDWEFNIFWHCKSVNSSHADHEVLPATEFEYLQTLK